MAKINIGRIKFSFQGDWNKNTNYRTDDIVWHDNCFWILKQPYYADGSESCAPGEKNKPYRWHDTFSNDPDFRRGYHQLRDSYRQRTNAEGSAMQRNSDYGSGEPYVENDQEELTTNTGYFLDHQYHLLHEWDKYAQGDMGNFFGYGEENTEKQKWFQHFVPVRNNFNVTIQTSPNNRFKFDQRLGSATIGQNFDGSRNFTHFIEGETYRFYQNDQTNSTFPLGFSYTVDGEHNASPGTSLANDPDGPYYIVGTTSSGDAGIFYPLYKSAAGANAEDTRMGGQGASTSIQFSEMIKGPNGETDTNDSTTFYLPNTIDGTAVKERTFEVQVVTGNPSDHPYYNTGSTSKYSIDGSTATANVALNLIEGKTYRFDQSHSSNAGHPLRFSTTANGTHASGTEYTTGVKTVGTPGTKGAYTQITLAKSVDKLYYYCTQHSSMGWSAETITPSTRGKSKIPTNMPRWRGMNKNGYVRYWLNGKQVTESQYKTTFENNIAKDGSGAEYFADYPQKTMEDGTVRGGHQYNFDKVNSRYVEIYIPIGTRFKGNTTIYPYCLQSGAARNNMYNSQGFFVEQAWRGFKHWDLVQTSLRFRGEYQPHTQYVYNDLVLYRREKRLASGEVMPRGNNTMYRCLRDNKGRPPHDGYPQEPTMSPLMAKTSTTSGRRTAKPYQEYPAHIQSYSNCWETITAMDNGQRNKMSWFPNKGPIHWPYKNGDSNYTRCDNTNYYIDRDGKVWARGYPRNGWQMAGSMYKSYWAEMNFKFRDWHSSEDKNWDGYVENTREHYTTKDKRRFGTPRAIQIEQGYAWCGILFENGEMYYVGENANGEGGWGHTQGSVEHFMATNQGDCHWIKIARNRRQGNTGHWMALDEEGDVWMWGYNDQGQLGNGRTTNETAPRKIPREWFDNHKIIDIVASDRTSYARTSTDEIYAWGNNGIGQMGNGDTTDRYRPQKMTGWDPTTNGGIAVWQISGSGDNGRFMLLDGNGYLWHTGDNAQGEAFDGSTSNHSTLTQSTVSPNGDIADFWHMCYGDSGEYGITYARLKNGQTWFSGHAGTYYIGGTGAQGSITTPTQMTNPDITNAKEICVMGDYSDYAREFILTDNNQMYCYGNDSANNMLHPQAGGNWTGENGVFKPFRCYIPAGARLVTMDIKGWDQGSSAYGGQFNIADEHGKIWWWGHSNWNSASHNWWAHSWNSMNGQMTNGGQGR